MMEKPAKHIRVSVKIEQQILQRIHSGALPVGSRLPSEPELAGQLGVSRGSLREALGSLEAKGYISRTQRGGSFIRQKSGSDIGGALTAQAQTAGLAELVEFREAIETKVVQYVIDRAGEKELASLRALLEDEGGAEGSTDYYFHYHLAELSQNTLFAAMLDMYYEMISRFAQGSYQSRERTRLMNTEHKKILEAIENRDKKAAVAAVKRHLRNALRRVSEDYDIDT